MKKLLPLLLCLLLLPGCAAQVELSMMAVCLGVDADADGIALTVKSPDYTSGAKEDKNGYTTLTAQGETWPRAVDALYAAAPVSLHFGQLREIVISRAAFEALPPEELLGYIDQLPGVRSHALVAVCPGTAREAVKAMEPVIGKRLSKYLDIALAHAEAEGSIPATSLSCAVRDLSGPWRDPVLAWTEGGAYALGDGPGGYLTEAQTQLLRLIRGEDQSYRLAYGDRIFGASRRRRARLSLHSADGQDTLMLTLPVTLTYSVYENPPAPGAEVALRTEIEALLRALQDLGCDALGFGCMAVRDYATLPLWLQSGWPERYRRAAVSVTVDVRCRQEAAR